MPRVSEKKQTQNHIDNMVRVELAAQLEDEETCGETTEEEEDEFIDDLLETSLLVSSTRYGNARSAGSAGKLPLSSVISHFLQFPKDGFLCNFRVHPDNFWPLVDILSARGGDDYWCQNSGQENGGISGHPVHEQVAVALYALGAEAAPLEKIRMKLNIGKGRSKTTHGVRLILLDSMWDEYVQWPSSEIRSQRRGTATVDDDVFVDCVGYLDGSEIPLRESPALNREDYFSKKKIYGSNLQAICDKAGGFVYACLDYTASAHDSTAFKASEFYRNRDRLLKDKEYILADKAYQLDKYIIPPYKLPAAEEDACKDFNSDHSGERIRIEHAFGVLKARWRSLKGLPLRIREDHVEEDHLRVAPWIRACIVLHNYLLLRGDKGFSHARSTIAARTNGTDTMEGIFQHLLLESRLYKESPPTKSGDNASGQALSALTNNPRTSGSLIDTRTIRVRKYCVSL